MPLDLPSAKPIIAKVFSDYGLNDHLTAPLVNVIARRLATHGFDRTALKVEPYVEPTDG